MACKRPTRSIVRRNDSDLAERWHLGLLPNHYNSSSKAGIVFAIISLFDSRIPFGVCSLYIYDRGDRSESPFQQKGYYLVAWLNFLETVASIFPTGTIIVSF